MSEFTEAQMAAFSWVYEVTLVEPGDFARRDLRDHEAIRSYNNQWSIRLPWKDIEGCEV